MDYSEGNYKGYYLKFAILIIAAISGELLIWWGMVREESVDWISGQIVHSTSHYAVSQTDDGSILVDNAIKGYQITLPAGFKVSQSKIPKFYYEEEENKTLCLISSEIANYKKKVDVDVLKKADQDLIDTSAGIVPAVKKEFTDNQGAVIYELVIPQEWFTIKYDMSSSKEYKVMCWNYFDQIRKSFISY